MPTYRTGFKMRLLPGCEAVYKEEHDQLWPEMKTLLAEMGITNYTIYRDGLDLFSHLESSVPQTPGESVHPVMRRWWDAMRPYMEYTETGEPKSWPIEEMFHFEPE